MSEAHKMDDFLKEISGDRANAIRGLFKEKSIKKNTLILREGEICSKNYIIRKGAARRYFNYLDREVTLDIYLEGAVVFSFESFTYQLESKENIVAITDIECISIDFSDYLEAKKKYPWFVEYDLMFLEQYTAQLENRLKELATLNAAERYEKILTHHPELLQQVPLKVIASYLNVSVERLSRIRSGL